MEKKKPLLGQVVFGTILIIVGTIVLFTCFLPYYITVPRRVIPYWNVVAINLGGASPLLIMGFIGGFGLLSSCGWVRKFLLYLGTPFLCIYIPFQNRFIPNGNWMSWCPVMVPFLFGLSLCIYLIHPKVKEQFT